MENLLSKPKQTFLNLSDEKRELIEYVLVKEFATKGYQKASLNTIVKELGIAKGSLYQYFDNKESIFFYVFDQFTRLVKMSVVKPVSKQSVKLDFWESARFVLLAGVEFIARYHLYYQLYPQVLYEDNIPRRDELIRRVRLFSKEYFGPMIEACQAQGDFVQTPVATIIFILDAVMDRFFQAYARKSLDDGLGLTKKNAICDKEIEHILQILKFGIAGRN